MDDIIAITADRYQSLSLECLCLRVCGWSQGWTQVVAAGLIPNQGKTL